jgi:hypothetical protein
VLDLDETLVHCSEYEKLIRPDDELQFKNKEDQTIKVKLFIVKNQL